MNLTWRRLLPASLACLFLLLTALPATARTVTDMAGRTVEINGHATRLVTTYRPASLCVAALRLTDRLVGVESDARYCTLQKRISPGIRNLPGVGSKSTGLNFETILSVAPDLVILYSQKDGKALADRLTRYGVPAIIIEPESFAGLEEALRLIADAVGEPERADKTIAECNRVMDLAAKHIALIPPAKRRSVYFASPNGLFSTATGDILQNEIITRAGGINVGRDLHGYFREISPEQFLLWDPEFITISGRAQAKVMRRLAQPEFSGVSAVRTKSVYKFPCRLAPWDFPSPLSALGVLWMAKHLYPEEFTGIDLKTEIDRFHKTVFGMPFEALGGNLDEWADAGLTPAEERS